MAGNVTPGAWRRHPQTLVGNLGERFHLGSTPRTSAAPADWRKSVTLSRSPPKAAMFSRTERSAGTTSSRPRLAGFAREVREPGDAEPVAQG